MLNTPSNAPAPPALTADAMRAADRFAIEDYGLPGFTLMESAGRGCAASIRSAYGPLDGDAVIILCGKGNNGGDGLVVARCLYAAGARVHIVLTSDPDELRDDPAHNLELLKELRANGSDGRLTIATLDTLTVLEESANRLAPRLYVDALLGTGLTSELREPIRSLVAWLNDRAEPTVAIDVPTGLHSDTGTILGTAVMAERTVTMAAPKVGLVVGKGPTYAGRVEVVDIGIPAFVVDREAQASGCVRLTTDEAVRWWWPKRDSDAYKYSVGTAMVVGGSRPYAGAPAIASKAAVRSGAGYVTCACPETIQAVLASSLIDVPTLSLPSADGGVSPEAVDCITNERADAMLVGPGLGRGASTRQFVTELVQTVECPLVVDADGLNALADGDDDWTEYTDGNWILTPHAGEFRRLAGDVDLDDRVRTVQEHAQRWNVVLLLKGSPSIVAGPEGRTYVATSGTPALASAGTGDVLAGQCVGLLAQGVAPLEAAATALHLGGAAAQRYAATRDGRSMAATDLVEELPAALHDRLHGTTE